MKRGEERWGMRDTWWMLRPSLGLLLIYIFGSLGSRFLHRLLFSLLLLSTWWGGDMMYSEVSWWLGRSTNWLCLSFYMFLFLEVHITNKHRTSEKDRARILYNRKMKFRRWLLPFLFRAPSSLTYIEEALTTLQHKRTSFQGDHLVSRILLGHRYDGGSNLKFIISASSPNPDRSKSSTPQYTKPQNGAPIKSKARKAHTNIPTLHLRHNSKIIQRYR